jgi:hypothetical protein
MRAAHSTSAQQLARHDRRPLAPAFSVTATALHGSPRRGGVRKSFAEIAAAEVSLGFVPRFSLEHGSDEYAGCANDELQGG